MKNSKPKRKHIPVPDFRNVERGKRELADMIRDSERKDKERQGDDDKGGD